MTELVGRGARRGRGTGATDVGGDVTVRAAHTNRLSLRSARAGTYCGIAALLVFLGVSSLGSTAARGETRTISFHHIHTGEDLTVTYKVNGRYDDEALNKINHLLRDWRESEKRSRWTRS